MKKSLLKILIPVIAVVFIAGACVAFFALKHEHKYTYEITQPSTCVTEGVRTGTCSCGEVKIQSLPLDNHDWQEATCTKSKTCSVCGETEGSVKNHNWQEATCSAPKTCSACGTTEGEALSHNWQEATCSAPKTCSACAATEGDALAHTWQEATCSAPKTCSVCSATEGTAEGHSFVNKKCTTCNEWQYTAAEYFIFIPENDGSYSIMAADVNNMPAEVVIPASHEGKPVTAIAKRGFYNCSSITSILLPESITAIENSAFYGCFKLVEVINMSQSLTVEYNEENGYLGYYALTISNHDSAYVSKVSSINGYVTFTEGSEKLLLGYEGSEGALTVPAGITKIYNYAFYKSALASIEIASSVKEIGSHAFDGCLSLTAFEAGSSVTSIGEYAFDGCLSLTAFEAGSCVTSIGEYAFNNCSSLSFIQISASVNAIESFAFYGCTGLTDMNYLGSIDQWVQIDFETSESNPTYHTNKLVIAGNEVLTAELTTATVINSYAFWNCKNLTAVVIGESVTAISHSVFGGCDSLTEITFEDSENWFAVRNKDNWHNATGGSAITIGSPAENVSTLKENTYQYWYKK